MKNQNVDNAYSFNIDLTHKLKEACLPLEKNLGITLLGYRRFYFNGDLLCLLHLKDWMDYSYQNQCWGSSSFYTRVQHLTYNNTIYYLWPETPPAKDKVYRVLYDCGIWNGVVIYKKFFDCIEAFAFASLNKKDSSARNIYLLEKDIFERFILYFKEKIFPLVIPIEKQILIPTKLDFSSCFVKNKQVEDYFAETNVQNYYFRVRGKDINLTKKQESCLSLFAKHKKMKETGKILGLNDKTVESYLRKTAKKFGCNTKSQLIQIYETLR